MALISAIADAAVSRRCYAMPLRHFDAAVADAYADAATPRHYYYFMLIVTDAFIFAAAIRHAAALSPCLMPPFSLLMRHYFATYADTNADATVFAIYAARMSLMLRHASAMLYY